MRNMIQTLNTSQELRTSLFELKRTIQNKHINTMWMNFEHKKKIKKKKQFLYQQKVNWMEIRTRKKFPTLTNQEWRLFYTNNLIQPLTLHNTVVTRFEFSQGKSISCNAKIHWRICEYRIAKTLKQGIADYVKIYYVLCRWEEKLRVYWDLCKFSWGNN